MKHLIETTSWTQEEVNSTLALAKSLKKGDTPPVALQGKMLSMLFLNPSLRTRVSFVRAMQQLGGQALALDPGKDMWKLATETGVVMNGDQVEHIREAIPVLARYSDFLAIRSFEEKNIARFAELSTVPFINLESADAHPCQAFADCLTIQEKVKKQQPKVVLTWAPHIKSVPSAVPNSFLLLASRMGWNVTLAHPKGFALAPEVIQQAQEWSKKTGGTFEETQDRDQAFSKASVIYAKSWGGPGPMDWTVDESSMQKTDDAIFLHCLPIRRNVEATDGVLDSNRSKVVDQAENRLHVQKAILCQLALWKNQKE